MHKSGEQDTRAWGGVLGRDKQKEGRAMSCFLPPRYRSKSEKQATHTHTLSLSLSLTHTHTLSSHRLKKKGGAKKGGANLES